MVIIEGIQWEITICDCDDWKQIIPGGDYDIVFVIVFLFMSTQG